MRFGHRLKLVALTLPIASVRALDDGSAVVTQRGEAIGPADDRGQDRTDGRWIGQPFVRCGRSLGLFAASASRWFPYLFLLQRSQGEKDDIPKHVGKHNSVSNGPLPFAARLVQFQHRLPALRQ